jgi:hypothetical protein
LVIISDQFRGTSTAVNAKMQLFSPHIRKKFSTAGRNHALQVCPDARANIAASFVNMRALQRPVCLISRCKNARHAASHRVADHNLAPPVTGHSTPQLNCALTAPRAALTVVQ